MLAEERPDNAGYRTFRHGNPCNTDMRLLSLPSTENPYHRMLKNPQRRHVRHIPWPSAGRSNAVEMKVDRTLVHIVDDNATFRKTIEGRLEQFGYAVSTYPSAQHLLDCLPNDAAPSCILLDVRMPLMSGPELQERLGELGSTLPIIFVTGYA